MKRFGLYGVVFGCLMMVSACASVNAWAPAPGETYQNMQRAKLSNTAFAQDYKEKLVTFKANFGLILDRPKITDYDPTDYFGITLDSYTVNGTPEDNTPTLYYVIVQKKDYDMISSLKFNQHVEVSGRTFELNSGLLGLHVHNIKPIN